MAAIPITFVVSRWIMLPKAENALVEAEPSRIA
jgi:hypothetical protein